MPQLRPGARQALDYLVADLNDIVDLARDNPATVQDLALKCIRRLKEEIEPQLQRAAPAIERRLAALEERMKQIEQRQIYDRP